MQSSLTVEDLAAVGVNCDDDAELRYIAKALAALENWPATMKGLLAFIAVRAHATPKAFSDPPIHPPLWLTPVGMLIYADDVDSPC